MKESRRTYRLNPVCVQAIEDIRKNIRENLNIQIPFQEGSRILGEKYVRGHLALFSYDEIKKTYRKERRFKMKGMRCV